MRPSKGTEMGHCKSIIILMGGLKMHLSGKDEHRSMPECHVAHENHIFAVWISAWL
jgi:hypothetical protein